ncbi:MAG: polyphosphate kinase 1 [Gaiellaceae bacterium]
MRKTKAAAGASAPASRKDAGTGGARPAGQRKAARRPLLNRELSWLDFNARVLELAADAKQPLLERAFFCSIFSANLDEFFMVRVAGLLDQISAGVTLASPDGMTPAETLAAIHRRVLDLTRQQARLWEEELVPALAAERIRISPISACNEVELAQLTQLFEQEIYPLLTPLGVGPGRPFPYISPLSLSLGLLAIDPESGEERFARVKLPETLPRFLPVGRRGLRIPIEDLVGHFLDRLFPGIEVVEYAVFRVTRDADFELSDEADDLLEAVRAELRRRRFGDVVRLEVAAGASERLLAHLTEGLTTDPQQVYPIRGLLDLADAIEIAELRRPEHRFEPWGPVTRTRLRSDLGRELFKEIRRGDIVVHHPYDSFATSVERFVEESADDPKVIAIKTTVYRTNDESPLVPALIDAADSGKQTVCLVELKARFDERRNIEWSRRLEQAGVHVVHGFPNLKIHAKTTLVLRREGKLIRRYVHIGTGNYHSVTARTYEDFGLFTDDEEITADVADLFNYLTGFSTPRQFRKIIVAPFSLRSRLLEEIQAVVAANGRGEHARIRIKVNAITDVAVIEALYEASQAGVPVEIVCRGICCLVPGVAGVSESIRVVSVLGRFLEHSRVFAFEAGEDVRVFMGSADLMPRNLDNRVEVVVPVEDMRAREELRGVLDILLEDSTQAWLLDADGHWTRLRRKGGRTHGAQAKLMRRARARARRATAS